MRLEGEALRNDDEYAYVAGWLYRGADKTPALAKEALQYENIKLAQRSYK
jgi:succinate dehydrogenase / fumarate reductase flavoprotein subunit